MTDTDTAKGASPLPISALREAWEKTSGGPWATAGVDPNGQPVVRGDHFEVATLWHHCVGSIEKEAHANAAFIALAHREWPNLLSAIERMEGENARLKAALIQVKHGAEYVDELGDIIDAALTGDQPQ